MQGVLKLDVGSHIKHLNFISPCFHFNKRI
nr:MAG TPA: hypothetical protein [Caudoviricetes sp.]